MPGSRAWASVKPKTQSMYRFYERQAEGVGAYFLDSLYSDIDSLLISAGNHLGDEAMKPFGV